MTTDNTMKMALGRLFRIMSRPSQPGDELEYERIRAVVMDTLAPEGVSLPKPSFAYGSPVPQHPSTPQNY